MLFFFLLPLQTRYIIREVPFYEYGTLSVYGIEIVGWIVILLYCYIAISRSHMRARSIAVLGMTFAGWAFLSMLWSPDRAVALQGALVLLEGVLLYLILRNPSPQSSPARGEEVKTSSLSLHGRGQGEGVMWAFIIGAVVQAGLGIYQFLTQSSFASTLLGMALHDPRALGTSVVEFGTERWLRAYGGLPHPNVLGGYLAVALAVVFIVWRKINKTLPDKIQCGRTVFCQVAIRVAIPVLLTGIFFTFSRAAWFATLLLLVFLWCGEKRAAASNHPQRFRVTNPYILLTIFYIFILAFLYRPLIGARVAGDARLEVKSRAERMEGLREAWTLIKKHPVAGVGIGNYTQAVRRDLRPNDPLYSYQPVHSVPLLVWAELGVVGLALFIFVLYILWRQSPNYILLTTFYILLVFDHYLWTLPFGALLFWSVLGLSTNPTKPAS